MTILTFANHKGGTGKTTSVINVAAAIGLRQKKVLVIDLDPQGFLSRMMGIDEPKVDQSSMMLFNPEVPFNDVPVYELSSFDLLPASGMLSKWLRNLTRPTDVFWVKEALQQRTNYDLVLIDTAAALTVYTLNALVASHGVIIPVTPEYQPVVGAEQAYRTALTVKEKLNPDLVLPFFLFTQVDARIRTHLVLRHYIRDKYKGRALNRYIRTSTALSTTTVDGTTVYDVAPTSRGARDYANITEELLGYVLPDFSGMVDVPSDAPKKASQIKVALDETESKMLGFLGQIES